MTTIHITLNKIVKKLDLVPDRHLTNIFLVDVPEIVHFYLLKSGRVSSSYWQALVLKESIRHGTEVNCEKVIAVRQLKYRCA